MKQRWKLTIEYDGAPFCGWQRQENGLSVQECLETAIFKFSGEHVRAQVAGRTDAGVHAVGQVAHVDLSRPCDEKTMRDAVNFHMRPHPVAIVRAKAVPDSFNARTGAVRRSYCYRFLINRRADAVIDGNRAWHVKHDLDIAAMNKAAQYLIGEHDFSSFRAAECQSKSPVKSLERLEFVERADPLTFGRHVDMWAEARSFLHHQIRNFAGTLRMVGEGKWSPEKVREVLEMRDRTKAGPMAPPHALYFVKVDYREDPVLAGMDSLL